MTELASTVRMIDPSPEGFAAAGGAAKDNVRVSTTLSEAGMPFSDWARVGGDAWSAWSVAQVDYNAEAPLRDNARQLLDARQQLAAAQSAVKSGLPVMSADDRARRVAAAMNAATDAADRAELWSQKATTLRERIADLLPTGAADTQPLSPPLVEALERSGAARLALAQELAAAERNQKQERDNAARFQAAAEHPDQPPSATEKSDLLRGSQVKIELAQSEIARCQEDARTLRARLSEDRRVDAPSRKKTASETDIDLLRKHLAEFNDLWGMTIEGRTKE